MRYALQMCCGLQVTYLRTYVQVGQDVNMSSATNTDILEEPRVSLLPIIVLHATDPEILYSLLSFATEQCKIPDIDTPCVTTD